MTILYAIDRLYNSTKILYIRKDISGKILEEDTVTSVKEVICF